MPQVLHLARIVRRSTNRLIRRFPDIVTLVRETPSLNEYNDVQLDQYGQPIIEREEIELKGWISQLDWVTPRAKEKERKAIGTQEHDIPSFFMYDIITEIKEEDHIEYKGITYEIRTITPDYVEDVIVARTLLLARNKP